MGGKQVGLFGVRRVCLQGVTRLQLSTYAAFALKSGFDFISIKVITKVFLQNLIRCQEESVV